MVLSLIFYGRGNKNLVAKHKTTLEFTKDDWLTERGDCILLVSCNMAPRDFPEEIKQAIRRNQAKIKFVIRVEGLEDTVVGFGHPALTLTDDRSMVVRKSGFISPRTVAIHANKSAADIKRELVAKLRREASASVELIVED